MEKGLVLAILEEKMHCDSEVDYEALDIAKKAVIEHFDKIGQNADFAKFEELWKMYPNKQGKAGVSTKAKKEVQKNFEAVQKAISNYKRSKPAWQNWLNGSTFFNGRWRDWVDSPTPPPKTVESKSNFNERQYSKEFLDNF